MAHIVSYYPPDRIGGVGEHVRVIHEGHVELGIDSKVLTSGKSHSDPRVLRVGPTPMGFLFQSWRLARYASRCNVVHAHHGEGLLLLLSMRLRRNRPRILVMFHVDVRERDRASGPHKYANKRYGPSVVKDIGRRMAAFGKALIDRVAWVLADSVVVETEAVRHEISNLRPRRQISVISHGLGPSDPAMSEISKSHVELLYVGTPGIRKRTHLLPFILHRVREQLPTARLRIVGFDADGDPDLRFEAERLGVLSAIDFVGPVRSEKVVPYYRASDVLVLPSAYEGLPMVLLEAMREGLVPVATNVSGHPEAIEDGLNGYLVPLDQVSAMASKCVLLLEQQDRAARMGVRARQTMAERFASKCELNAYIDLYARVLTHH